MCWSSLVLWVEKSRWRTVVMVWCDVKCVTEMDYLSSLLVNGLSSNPLKYVFGRSGLCCDCGLFCGHMWNHICRRRILRHIGRRGGEPRWVWAHSKMLRVRKLVFSLLHWATLVSPWGLWDGLKVKKTCKLDFGKVRSSKQKSNAYIAACLITERLYQRWLAKSRL